MLFRSSEKALNRLREIVKPPRENKPKNESQLPTNERAKVESALAYIPADCGYDEWYKIGAAIIASLARQVLAFGIIGQQKAASTAHAE